MDPRPTLCHCRSRTLTTFSIFSLFLTTFTPMIPDHHFDKPDNGNTDTAQVYSEIDKTEKWWIPPGTARKVSHFGKVTLPAPQTHPNGTDSPPGKWWFSSLFWCLKLSWDTISDGFWGFKPAIIDFVFFFRNSDFWNFWNQEVLFTKCASKSYWERERVETCLRSRSETEIYRLDKKQREWYPDIFLLVSRKCPVLRVKMTHFWKIQDFLKITNTKYLADSGTDASNGDGICVSLSG